MGIGKILNMKFLISLILNFVILGGLFFSVNELHEADKKIEEFHRTFWDQEHKHSRIMDDYKKIKAELNQTKTDMSKLSDMFSIHMRSHR